jgi:hypothetical protein
MFHDQLPVRYKLHSRVRNVAIPPIAQHTNFSKDGRRCRPGATQVLSILHCSHYNWVLGEFSIQEKGIPSSEVHCHRSVSLPARQQGERGLSMHVSLPLAARSPMRMRPCGDARRPPRLARQPPPAPCAARARACGPRGQLRGSDTRMRIPRWEIPQTPKKNYAYRGAAVPLYIAVQYRLRLVPPGVSKSNPRRRDRHHRPPSPTPTHCPTLRSCHSKRTPSG